MEKSLEFISENIIYHLFFSLPACPVYTNTHVDLACNNHPKQNSSPCCLLLPPQKSASRVAASHLDASKPTLYQSPVSFRYCLHAYTNSTNLNTIFHWARALQVQTLNNAAVALGGLLPPLSSLTSKISSFQNISQTLVRTNICGRSWSLRGHNNQSWNHTTAPHTKFLYTISSSLPTHRHMYYP